MKARKKRRMAELTTGCWTNQAACIKERQRVRQPAVRYPQKKQTKKEQTHAYTDTQECMLASMIV